MPAKPRLSPLARELRQFVRDCPCAQDTFEGILVWWVSDRAIRHWLPQVRGALEALVQRGDLEVHRAADGHSYYRATTSRQAPPKRVRKPCRPS